MNPNNSLTIQMNIPIIILIIVFIFIIARQIGRFKFGIWQVMLAGALAVLVTGQITPEKAVASINQDVMLFLCGMFVIGAAIEQSGYLSSLSGRLFSKAKNTDMLILMFLFVFGILSAFLMNDTPSRNGEG